MNDFPLKAAALAIAILAFVAVAESTPEEAVQTYRVALERPVVPLGYVLRGVGLAGIGAAALWAPREIAPLAMAAAGFVLGVGGSMAFLQMMPEHHHMAVEMAEQVQKKGRHPELKELAAKIAKDQQEEIKQMKAWAQAWFGPA